MGPQEAAKRVSELNFPIFLKLMGSIFEPLLGTPWALLAASGCFWALEPCSLTLQDLLRECPQLPRRQPEFFTILSVLILESEGAAGY